MSFRASGTAVLAIAVELCGLCGLLFPSWGSTNLTSCSGRFGAVASGLDWAGGGLRYLETGLSVSAHRSCSCSSTWGTGGPFCMPRSRGDWGTPPTVAAGSVPTDDMMVAS